MELNVLEQIKRFQDFIESNYYDSLLENARKGNRFLIIDFDELSKYDPDLATELLDQPEETIKAIEKSIEQFDIDGLTNFRARIKNIPASNKYMVGTVRSNLLGKFVCLEGFLLRKSEVRPRTISCRFECPNCGNILNILQLESSLKEPTKCGCGRKGKFTLLDKELVDVQSIVIQEKQDELEGAAQPQTIHAILKEDLVVPYTERRLNPGSIILVNGIVKEIPVRLRSGETSTTFDIMVEVNYLELIGETFEDIKISSETEAKIKEVAKKNPMALLVNAIAPTLHGHKTLKEAILLQFFGGVRKTLQDGREVRGDSHTLIIGDPACQPAGSKVMLADGSWKNIEKINIGDKILSPQKDGRYIYAPVQNINKWWCDNIYDITQINRQHKLLYSCSYNHIIPVHHRVIPRINGIREREARYWDYKHFSAKDFSNLSKENKIRKNVGFSCFLIPKFKNRENCEIEPYTLGIYLGDGYYSVYQIKHKYLVRKIGIATADDCVIKEVSKHYTILRIEEDKRSKNINYYFSAKGELVKLLTKYGLAGAGSEDKFIPKEALYSDAEYRKRLLAGLIDSDGYLSKTSSYSILTKSKKLAEGITHLVYSLGGRANTTIKHIKYKNTLKHYYIICFYLGKLRLPLKINRKQKTSKEVFVSSDRVAINSIPSQKKGWVYGIEINSSSKWYITDNYMVTHNSGKTAMLKFLTKIVPKWQYVSGGPGASGKGIAAVVVKDELLSKAWTVDAGAAVLAHNGVLFFDELDKMQPEDRSALHEIMESQCFSIHKAGINTTLLARTTIVAAANPKGGRFDPYTELYTQLDLPPTLINRFDLIFPLKDVPDEKTDDEMSRHMLKSHRKQLVLEKDDVNPFSNKKFIKLYIAYARTNCFPELTDEAEDLLHLYYTNIRKQAKLEEGRAMAIPINPRYLEGLIRISEQSARSRLSEKVTLEDAKRAIRIIDFCLEKFGYDPLTGKIDVDRISGVAIPASKKDRYKMVLEIIKDCKEKIGKEVPISNIITLCKEKGILEDEAEETIERFKRDGTIFEPRYGYISMI